MGRGHQPALGPTEDVSGRWRRARLNGTAGNGGQHQGRRMGKERAAGKFQNLSDPWFGIMDRRVDKLAHWTVRRMVSVLTIAVQPVQRRKNQRPDDEYDCQYYGESASHENGVRGSMLIAWIVPATVPLMDTGKSTLAV